MRKDFGAQTWLYPMPVLIIGTYDGNGTANAMNAAWGGIHNTNRIAICIDKSHKTAKNLLARKAFTVSPADAAHVAECDYVGLVSGNDVPDKLQKTGFTVRKAAHVDAPYFEELPMTLECRLVSYDPAAEVAIGEIVNISAAERILGDDGKIAPEKFEPVCFDPIWHKYHKLGAVAGNAFKDGLKLK